MYLSQESLGEWYGLLDHIDGLPRNPTTFSKQPVSVLYGNILCWLAEGNNKLRGAYKKEIAHQKIESLKELDEKLKPYMPSTRHDAIHPTVGTRRKHFHGDVVRVYAVALSFQMLPVLLEWY